MLLVFGAPCQLPLLAGPERGRTIPLADMSLVEIPRCSTRPRFRTIQVCPKDLASALRQAEHAVSGPPRFATLPWFSRVGAKVCLARYQVRYGLVALYGLPCPERTRCKSDPFPSPGESCRLSRIKTRAKDSVCVQPIDSMGGPQLCAGARTIYFNSWSPGFAATDWPSPASFCLSHHPIWHPLCSCLKGSKIPNSPISCCHL